MRWSRIPWAPERFEGKFYAAFCSSLSTWKQYARLCKCLVVSIWGPHENDALVILFFLVSIVHTKYHLVKVSWDERLCARLFQFLQILKWTQTTRMCGFLFSSSNPTASSTTCLISMDTHCTIHHPKLHGLDDLNICYYHTRYIPPTHRHFEHLRENV